MWFRTDALREDPEGGGNSHEVAADSKALVRRTAGWPAWPTTPAVPSSTSAASGTTSATIW